MVSTYVLAFAVTLSFSIGVVIGHHMGFRYGRTELFESAKRYGGLLEDKYLGGWWPKDERKKVMQRTYCDKCGKGVTNDPEV